MTPIGKEPHPPSSEPNWITIKDGSDRDWRLISMYELKKLEHAINEECVGRTDSCPPGHLKEMHDSGNDVIDKVRSRPYSSATSAEKVLEKAILICQNLYKRHYGISMSEHVDGYDNDDQREVKQNHWSRACGALECVSKLTELRQQQGCKD